jgi:hypothetical protein
LRVRPLRLIAAVLLALSVATASALAQDPPPPAAPPALAATLEQCATSALPAERVAEFVGSMPAAARATRMRMRFDLERLRPRDGQWRRMRGVPGFGAWEASAPARAGFVFHKRVDGLLVPASYRAVVRFRWEDSGGGVVRRARRRTPACAQPDLRPNLVPGALTGLFFDGRPGLAIYRLVVRNTGRSPAGPFGVRVGSATTEVDGLAPQQERTILVLGPICLAGTTTLAVVDADGRVDESFESGNAVARRCPLWGI